VELVVIEGLNYAVNFGMEFLLLQEVSISCLYQEAKLATGSVDQERLTRLCSVTGNVDQERLTRLCSVTGSPLPFMNKGGYR